MLLEIKNVNKSFGKVNALKDINLKLKKNKIIGLLGSNGSGKTTLIKAINELITIDSGEIIMASKPLDLEAKKNIAYLPERTYLNPNMKVKEYIEYFYDFYENFDGEKAIKLMNDLEIDINAKLKTLSKGTKEKVQLVLVMSRKADLYILDEPIGGVDPAARDKILDTILNNFNKDATIIISTHLISDIERILDEAIFIKSGEIILHEKADKLREKDNKSIDEIFREEFKC